MLLFTVLDVHQLLSEGMEEILEKDIKNNGSITELEKEGYIHGVADTLANLKKIYSDLEKGDVPNELNNVTVHMTGYEGFEVCDATDFLMNFDSEGLSEIVMNTLEVSTGLTGFLSDEDEDWEDGFEEDKDNGYWNEDEDDDWDDDYEDEE